MNYSNYSELSRGIQAAQNLVLCTHTNPDGDTLGSALGLYHFLKSIGINAQVLSPDAAPDFLNWMPAYDEIILHENHPAEYEAQIQKADLILHIDYNAFHRTGRATEELLKKAGQTQHMMIDHHPNPEDGYDAYLSDTTACSTAQLIYQLTQFMASGRILSRESSTCLYVGLITDTGSFSYGIKDEKPYLIASELMKSGIDDRWIHEKVYSNNTLNRLKLLGYALSEKLVVVEHEKWAYISLDQDELDKYHHQAGDTEGLVNYALSIKGVNAAVLLTHRSELIRLSFRSKGNFAINQIAHKNFGGGGHLNAAGGNSSLSMKETIVKLRKVMSPFVEELKSMND